LKFEERVMDLVNPILPAVVLGAASIGLVGFGVREFVMQGDRINRRLAGGGPIVGARGARLVEDDSALRSLESILTPKDEERQSKIAKRLALAGYRHPAAVRIYFAVKWGIAIAGFVAAAFLFAATMSPAKPQFAIIATLLTVTISFFAADMQVERRRAYRKTAVEKSFPDALDLMLVCIEAGQGLDQALQRVSIEIRSSAPVLAEELSLVVGRLRAGKDRATVLADFGERIGVEDVAAFVTVIRQADKFGVSIADTLRVYSSEMRSKRHMRAEEKANMMPVQLALGAIIFTVPPTIIVLIGPSIIMIAREMMKAAGSGM
jgi:tight adherence protein C